MDRKGTSGACQILGGKLVCWSAKKQQSVAMSSATAEYVVVVGCCASILWMKSQLSNYDIHYKMVPIFCDNTSAIVISNNPIFHSKTKHIDIRYHSSRDHILKEILNYTSSPLMVYQNFLREFWSTVVAYDPFPSTDETEQRPLREFLIKFLVLNGQRPLTLDFNTYCSSTDLDYNNGNYVAHPTPEAVNKELGKITLNPSYLDKTLILKNSFPVAWRILFTFVIQVLGGNYSSTKQVNSIQQLLAFCLITRTEVDIGEIIYSDLVTKLLNKSRLKFVSYPRFISCALQVLLGSDYTQDKKFGFLPGILSNSNFTKDPSKVTDIELTAHMIAVNSQKDSVSPLPLAAKSKKGKSQTVTSTLPKSQGHEVPRALFKKSKRPKSKKPRTETKVTPPKPTKDSEQSHSVSLCAIPDPQDLERNIQLASTGLPSILDEGTRTAKTTSRPEGSLGDKDSGGNIPPTDMEPINPTVADLSGTDVRAFLLSDDEAQESKEDILGVASDTDSSCDDILKKHDNILPLTERQLVKYLRKMSNALFARITEDNWEKHEEVVVNYADLKASIDDYYDENIAHRDQTDKLVEASMSSFDKSSNTISDLYKGLNIITELLKEIKNAVKDDFVIKKITEATELFIKLSTNITDLQSSVNTLQAHSLKQDEELAAWAKSSTNMA
ncbi:hypothetical protein Tco_1199107 [Tanacetum coccineum]